MDNTYKSNPKSHINIDINKIIQITEGLPLRLPQMPDCITVGMNIQSESINPDSVYLTNPPSDTLLPVIDLAPL